MIHQGPLTRPCGPTSPPKGEVSLRDKDASLHLSLGGEVAAQRRVRGPYARAGALL